MENLKNKTAKGLMWGAVNNGMAQLLTLAIGICLGRLLTPADYGIVGVLTIFTALAGCLQASGFTQGLINLKQPTARDYNSVFWFNILASITLYAILFLSAPLIARFFKQPCLVGVSRVVFLTLPLSALGITYHAHMLKNMMNRQLAVITFWALVVSGTVGISLAFNGFRYWSLAAQQLVYITVLNIGRYHYVAWRPSWHIDFGPVRQMFSFCVKLLVTNIINTLNQNLLTFIFGRLFPIHAVGNYTQAYKWNSMAHSTISGTVGQIAQPVLVTVADERDRLRRVFRKMLRFTSFLSFPAMLGLAFIAREFILTTIGSEWLGCVPLLQLLCIGGAVMPLHVLCQNLVVACGRSSAYMWSNIAQTTTLLVLVLALHSHGITAIVCAYSVLMTAWMLVWHAMARRLTGITLVEMLKDTLPFLLATAAAMAAAWWLTKGIAHPVLLMAARIAATAAAYAGIMRLVHAKVMDDCIRFIRNREI